MPSPLIKVSQYLPLKSAVTLISNYIEINQVPITLTNIIDKDISPAVAAHLYASGKQLRCLSFELLEGKAFRLMPLSFVDRAFYHCSHLLS